jgi:hypothetical protein
MKSPLTSSAVLLILAVLCLAYASRCASGTATDSRKTAGSEISREKAIEIAR